MSPLTIQTAHDSAFDVEAVTKQFFDEYKAIFRILEDDLSRQTKDKIWAHDYALQFLNRTMFLYFVQRKRWLGDDTEFLRSFWESYKTLGQPKDTFVAKWLSVMFFEAFNNKFHGGHRHFPEHIKKALSFAPFLNGGLFKENELDDKVFTITDTRFQQVFNFLEGYNFTIAEDSPLDQEVAVDPEMIGKVYESLVNVSTEADERGDAGIFYTPRTEIDLMCRLALVDHLANHLGNEHKNLLYEVVFAMDQDEKDAADKALSKAGLWEKLSAILRDITALDPACGSGSFIVGMLHIIDDLQRRANLLLGIKESGFDRKKRIIGQSLYGVDIMDWAVHVAELRLWLSLVIDAEFTREELHVRREPLLPHFSFKIRRGDSLVQEIGGINFGHIKASRNMPCIIPPQVTAKSQIKLTDKSHLD
jgi:type I restriction-modification system DNA methylase subunit